MRNSTTLLSSGNSNCRATTDDCGDKLHSHPASPETLSSYRVWNVSHQPTDAADRKLVTFPFLMSGFRENWDGSPTRIRKVSLRNGDSLLFPFRAVENRWAGIMVSFNHRRSGLASSSRRLVRSAMLGQRFSDSSPQHGAISLKMYVFKENDPQPLRLTTIRLDRNSSPHLPITFEPIEDSRGKLYTVVLELDSAVNQEILVKLFPCDESLTSCRSKIYRSVSPAGIPYYCYSSPVSVGGAATPLVSVLIVTHNASGYLRKCLHSICLQDYPNVETVVVDNASQDATVGIIEKEFPEVKLLRMSANLDFCKGNNAGIPHCSGEYLFILNADTELEPHAVRKLVQAIEQAPYIAAAAPIISTKGSTTRYANVFLSSLVTGNKALLADNRLAAAPCGASFLVKTTVVKELGYLFDEGFVTNWEDHDFGLRCWLQGYVCVHVPEQLVWHVGGGVYGLVNSKRYRRIVRNELLTYFKNFPFSDFVKAFLLRTAGAVRSLNELIGVANFLRDFFKFIPERKRLQQGRKIQQSLFRLLASGAPYKMEK